MYQMIVKRLLDIAISVMALLFLLILFVILGPIIYFTDKGPIFYCAPRVGKNGKIFNMFKFRSMYVNVPDIRNEDGSTYNSEKDPRVTPIGRIIRQTSLDEIPQFLNTLFGTMSVIGPRPDLPTAIDKYTETERRKLKVRPGITGYNQAYFRNSVTWKECLEHDVYYVENLSFLFDVKIFIKTLESVIMQKGIHRN
ncbi:MAG: sugar transferase [Lachnospiraceae bacterium]|nr:sugar transferase [Lachnospiraceae bacterium]